MDSAAVSGPDQSDLSESVNDMAEPTERPVTLREFEQQLKNVQQLLDERMRYERELLVARQDALEKALQLASTEVARRLEELNHAHANAIANWRQSLPREVFESASNEWQKWRGTVNESLVGLTHMNATLVSIRTQIDATNANLDKIDKTVQQATGALSLVRFMGIAGVLALLVTFLRMAGVLK
jgi:hypothetical protein